VLPDVASTDQTPGLSRPPRSAASDHGQADPVLYGAAGIEVLRLAYTGVRSPG